ncbi:MAG: hypothetical protein M3245_00380 [Actinomycetota bacterium]|nr:hypothetical protein [Actinomycetota bacterium]
MAEALRPLRKAARWRDLGLEAGPEGIRVHRPADSDNGWLYDLWLAERLAERLGA